MKQNINDFFDINNLNHSDLFKRLNFDDDKFNKLFNILKKRDIYINLLIIDLTYINSNKDYGLEIGTKLKNDLHKLFYKYNDVIFEKIIGGKIIYITPEKINSEFKKLIDNYSKEIFNMSEKVLFFTEKKINKIDEQNIIELFNKAINYEISINQIRGFINKRIQSIFNKNKNIEEIWNENINYNELKFDFKDYKTIYKYIKTSDLLVEALNYFNKNELLKSKIFLIKYLLWVKFQELLFEGMKIEKIKTHLIINSDKNIDIEFNQILFWFDSTIKPLYPFMNYNDVNEYNLIYNKLKFFKKMNKEEQNNLIKELNKKITSLNIKGSFNIPINSLKISSEAYGFVKNQLILNFNKEKLNQKLFEMVNSNFIRKEFPICSTKNFNNFWDFIYFLNYKLINENHNLNINLAFLEIDGFNAFNTYIFSNDSDKIYNLILNSIFEVGNKYLFKSKLFRTLNVHILGDEFFFSFLSQNLLDKKEKEIIKKYLFEIRENILKITQNKKFIKTDKIKIKLIKENKEVIFRKIIKGDGFFEKYNVNIGTLGVSGVFIYNLNYKKSEFLNYMKLLEDKLNLVKKENKGNIIEINPQQ